MGFIAPVRMNALLSQLAQLVPLLCGRLRIGRFEFDKNDTPPADENVVRH
jgi:hypothetical protein